MNYRDIAIIAEKKAGGVLAEAFKHSVRPDAKGKHDVVSEIDYQSEKIIVDEISAAFPKHVIVAEESGRTKIHSEYAWYIDPLDGTANFLLGIPYFSVSLALAFKNDVILGVVYNPVLGELYIAEKEKGASLNGNPIHVSKQSELQSAFIASAYSAEERDIKRGLQTVEQLALHSRRVVINFSPALDLCNIARGRVDALVDNGTTPEDHAAGSLIVTEAGGKVASYSGNTFDVRKTGILATNGLLGEKIRDFMY